MTVRELRAFLEVLPDAHLDVEIYTYGSDEMGSHAVCLDSCAYMETRERESQIPLPEGIYFG